MLEVQEEDELEPLCPKKLPLKDYNVTAAMKSPMTLPVNNPMGSCMPPGTFQPLTVATEPMFSPIGLTAGLTMPSPPTYAPVMNTMEHHAQLPHPPPAQCKTNQTFPKISEHVAQTPPAQKPKMGKESTSTGRPCVVERQKANCVTLQTILSELQKEDPRCIFVVRKVNRLGFRSAEIVTEFFKTYGIVVRVLVAHSKVKPDKQLSGTEVSLRPGSLGFVVTKTPEVAQKILALGPVITVQGAPIRLQTFSQMPPSDKNLEHDC